jgi:hypothetical protein
VGLFVDDGSLALAILVIVLLSGIFATLMPDAPLVAGAVLLFGCLAVLLVLDPNFPGWDRSTSPCRRSRRIKGGSIRSAALWASEARLPCASA